MIVLIKTIKPLAIPMWPSKVWEHSALSKFHNLIVISPEELGIMLWLYNWTELTGWVWPIRVFLHCPDAKFHALIFLSIEQFINTPNSFSAK